MDVMEQIRRRLERVDRGVQKIEWQGVGDCPICHECPFCGDSYGGNEAETTHIDFDAYAAGVQVYGVGIDLEAFEDFVNNARQDIAFLLAYIEHRENCTDPFECKDGIEVGCYEAARRSLPDAARPKNDKCLSCQKEMSRFYLHSLSGDWYCVACYNREAKAQSIGIAE